MTYSNECLNVVGQVRVNEDTFTGEEVELEAMRVVLRSTALRTWRPLALACLEQYNTPCQELKMASELQIFEAEFGF